MIGTTHLEKDAISALRLLWFSPLLPIFGGLFQVCLLWAFNKFGHPWRRFLQSKDEACPIQVKKSESFLPGDFFNIWI